MFITEIIKQILYYNDNLYLKSKLSLFVSVAQCFIFKLKESAVILYQTY